MPTKERNRITVEDAVKQVTVDCAEIKIKLGMRSDILSKDLIPKIESEAKSIMAEKGRAYSPYEIGFRFSTNHLMAVLRNSGKITNEAMENRLRTGIGRVFYNPPKREHELYAPMLEDFIGDAALLSAMHEEFDRFIEIHDASGVRSDMFANPMIHVSGKSHGSFADWAEFERNCIETADNPFYE